MGVTFETFHAAGICPDLIERLNSVLMVEQMLRTQDFSIRAESPSGPLDLFISREHNISRISSSEQRMSVGQCSWALVMLFESSEVSDGSDVLKQAEKKTFKASALSTSLVTLISSTWSEGMEDLPPLRG